MKKRVETGGLKLGMYVFELDRPWLDAPFGVHSFSITTPELLTRLRQHCDYVFVETDLEMPESSITCDPLQQAYASPGLDRPELELEILRKYSDPGYEQTRYVDKHPVETEISTVRPSHEQTIQLVDDIMRQVTIGRRFTVGPASALISELTDSIINNPDALLCLSLMEQTHAPLAHHGFRSAVLAMVLGRHLGMDKKQLQTLGIGTLLHDIGKTQVPTEILECGHELNDVEQDMLREHVSYGVTILENTDGIPSDAIDVARYHHEHFDGTGYPAGLRGNEINQFGHIGAIVNFYDNLTFPPPGKRAVAGHRALKIMYERRTKSFHSQLVEEFIRCMGMYPIGSVVEMRSGEIGVVVALNRVRRLKPRVRLVMDSNHQHYAEPEIIDLTSYRNHRGESLEIARAMENNAFAFNPPDYLPVVT
jgi:putative nucleotidyltransferase with HDIG domain